MKWLWPGPAAGGITQSMISTYLQDPYCFVLYYGLGLEEPTPTSQEILWGNIIHKGLEDLIEIPILSKDFTEFEWEQILDSMKKESLKEIHTAPTSYHSCAEMIKLYNDSYKTQYDKIETEKEFQIAHATRNFEVTLMGKMDGIADPNNTFYESVNTAWTPTDFCRTLIEHKSKGYFEHDQFRREIKHDLQVCLYCHASQARHVIYDVFVVPETQWSAPKRTEYERDAAYIKKLYHGSMYKTYPVSKNKPFWVYQMEFDITSDWIRDQFRSTINPIIDQICMLYDYTSSDSFDPHNPDCYNHLFYKKPLRVFDPAVTNKYKSRYWSFLIGELDITQLRVTPKLFKELKIGN